MKRFLIVLSALVGLITIGQSQDIHFSQFYASPMTLNPALTGLVPCSYRATANYRNQWASVTTPYVTFSASYDMRILEEKLPGNDMAGVGLVIMNDKAGDGQLSNLTLAGSAAYHKVFGATNNMDASLGIQLSYTQRSIDESLLIFPNQFDVDQFNPLFPSGENISDNLAYPDFHAGGLFSDKFSEKVTAFAGFSMFHIIAPKESFLGDPNKLSNRMTIHAGAKYSVNSKIGITPNIIVMMQNGAREINVGTGVEYDLSKTADVKSAILGLGAWFRVGDAVILVPTVEWKNIRIGLSYDINISDLTAASNGRGGFEVSLTYLGCLAKGPTKPMLVPCPRL